MKDWTGNNKAIMTCLGASNHSLTEREENDYYATHPNHMKELLNVERFDKHIWECAVGGGHLANVLKQHGYDNTKYYDFLNQKNKNGVKIEKWDGDIITNPPYKYAKEFTKNALELLEENHKLAMFLKLTFLESSARLELFKEYPPKTIYVYSKRALCAKNGEFEKYPSSAVAYAWFIWKKGYKGNPIIKWI